MFRGVLKLEDQEYSKGKNVELEFTSQINLKGTVCVTSSDPCKWCVRVTTVPFTLLTEGR